MGLGMCCLAAFLAVHSGWVVSAHEYPAAIGGHSVGAGGRSVFEKKIAEDQSLQVVTSVRRRAMGFHGRTPKWMI